MSPPAMSRLTRHNLKCTHWGNYGRQTLKRPSANSSPLKGTVRREFGKIVGFKMGSRRLQPLAENTQSAVMSAHLCNPS